MIYIGRPKRLPILKQPSRGSRRNGEARLGLAYADLDMHKSQAAVHESQLAEEQMGDSLPLHLIRATAYGREGMLNKAADGISHWL